MNKSKGVKKLVDRAMRLRIARAVGVRVLAVLRHILTYARLKLDPGPWQLHLGCGQRRQPGFINIDHNFSRATDYRGDITRRLPLRDGTVSRIEAYHVIEHIPRPIVGEVLAYWLRLLAPHGTLVLECPDLAADMREYLDGNADRLFSVFGRQRFRGDVHYWGYTAESLAALLESTGYISARAVPATDYHSLTEPCIRVEAEAP